MAETGKFDEDQQKAAETIAKLLQLGHRNPNPNEAASALNRAAELALRHNLDLAAIGADAEAGSRKKEKIDGGFYDHQQWIWQEVARLNFCMWFQDGEWRERRRVTRYSDGTRREWKQGYWQKCHGLIGRRHNVVNTKVMAQYLETALERLVRQELEERGLDVNKMRWSRWAVSFRKGASLDICDRLRSRRRELEVAEEQKAAEAEARAKAAGMSAGTALTIAKLAQSEDDANRDVLRGAAPGTAARMRAEARVRAQQRAEAQRAAEAEYTLWAAEHPEKAARQEAARRREAEKRAAREQRRTESAGASYWKDVDWGAYSSGQKRAKAVGLDPQQDTGVGKGRGLGHG